MASAFAIMAKRRYQAVLARQAEKSARQKKKIGLQKPPASSEKTTVWYWEMDGMKTTLMFDIEKREVWCNGLVLKTETVMPENNIEQCSLAFTIDTSPECSSCGRQHLTHQHQHEQPSKTESNSTYKTSHERNSQSHTDFPYEATKQMIQPQLSDPKTDSSEVESIQNQINENSVESGLCTKSKKYPNSCDCLKCSTGKHKCVIKFIRVAVDQIVHELYVDGCMIQENTQNPYNYNFWKPQSQKKND